MSRQSIPAVPSPSHNPQVFDLDSVELLDREDLLKMVKSMAQGGVFINFHGKRSAIEIAKRVRPRVTRRLKELHVGSPHSKRQDLREHYTDFAER